MNDAQRIKDLIEKYLAQELSNSERVELDQWINESEHNRRLFDRLTDGKQLFEIKEESAIAEEKIARLIREKHPELALLGTVPVIPMRKFVWFKMIPAAAVVIVLGAAGYLWFKSNTRKEIAKTETHAPVADKAPGRDGAILKLSNGEEIVLDDAANGNLAKQGSTQITKQGAVLAYNSREKSVEVLYNTLSTPRGRQFQLALPDGSHVWLNAASSIKFPTAFTESKREVTISGEAYFEVKKDAAKPFRVLANGTQIEVLGTHFNVNAYADESDIRTTLVEGKVRIGNRESPISRGRQAIGNPRQVGAGRQSATSNRKSVILAPGEQARVKESEIDVVKNADISAALAWKNGLIVFSSADIKEVLRQVSRWYDVDIEYKSDIKVPEFYGEIPRTVNLSDVLKIIELNSRLRFTVAGNKVTVTQPQ